MSLPTSIHPFLITGNDANQFKVANSLRFRSSASAYLTRTNLTSSSRTTWTWSGWVKRGALSYSTATLFGGYISNFADRSRLYFESDDTLNFIDISASSVVTRRTTNAKFRDPSAWYHVVCTYDTTNATAASRIRLYVNNTLQSYSTATDPSLNYASGKINDNVEHAIGRLSTEYFDGYLAEVNFVDGQALDPSYFGLTDSLTNQWIPKKYTGTYGSFGFYLPFNSPITSSFSATFNGSSQYLTTAVNAGLGLGTSDFTIEYWMNVNSATNGTTVVAAGAGVASYDGLFGYITTGALVTYLSSTGGSWDIASNRTAIASITTGRWYHIAYTRSGSTWRVFVDGTQVDTFTSSASLYQSGNQFTLGRGQSTGYFNGSLSNVRVIKGTALYTSNFSPPMSPLTAVTNTQLLTIQDSTIIDNSTNAISITNTGTVTTTGSIIPWTNFIAGRDYSTNQFGWLSTNINATTSGTTYDVMRDSPTGYDDGSNIYNRGNYCTWNPVEKQSSLSYLNPTLSDGNMKMTATGSNQVYATGSIYFPSGKYYVEFTCAGIGVTTATYVSINSVISYYQADGTIGGITPSASGASYTTNDIIGAAFDTNTLAVSFYKNGVLQASGTATSSASQYYVWVSAHSSSGSWVINCGQRPFSYTPPAGFKALNSFNLPNPSLPLV